MTVKDVMGMFQDFSILAGEKAVNRELTSATVIDAPDIGNWIKGGEFVLSTGYAFRNDMEVLFRAVKQMSKSGACAFGIKLDRYIKELPKELVKYAEEHCFPIIYIPKHYFFVDIITPLQQILNRREFSSLEYSEYIHNLFMEKLMMGVTVREILNEVERLTHIQVALYQYYNDTVSFSEKAEELECRIRAMEGEKSLLSTTRELPFFELRLGSSVFGRMLFQEGTCYQGEANENNRIVIEQAATILILLIQREISEQKAEVKYRDEFIQDLLYENINSEEEIQNRAKLYHWDFSAGGLVVIVDVDDYKRVYNNKDFNIDKSRMQEGQRQLIFAAAKRVMAKYFTQIVYSYLSDQIVFILSERNCKREKLLNQTIKAGDEIRKIVSEDTDFTVMIGIGAYQHRIAQIHESFSQARKSVMIGRAVYSKNRTVVFEFLGVYKLLWAVKDTEEAEELQDNYMGKLLRYDDINHTELTQTVESLSKQEWNLLKTSKESFIHYNTIKYRFSKICEVLGVNLRLREEQINMDLSIKLYYLNRKEHGEKGRM